MKPQSIGNAFKHALNGMDYFIKHDRNGKIHITVAILVVAAGSYVKVSGMEWCILLLCIGMVISFEMLNHALEKLCDVTHDTYHPLIKTAKDVAAAAVLCSAITAAIAGMVIFIPKITTLL